MDTSVFEYAGYVCFIATGKFNPNSKFTKLMEDTRTRPDTLDRIVYVHELTGISTHFVLIDSNDIVFAFDSDVQLTKFMLEWS